jgi:beta-galactosidase beta subunit
VGGKGNERINMKIKELKEILSQYDENREFVFLLNKDNVLEISKSDCCLYYFDLAEVFNHAETNRVVHKIIIKTK